MLYRDRPLPRFLSAALIAVSFAGCAPPAYVEPAVNEPHGTVKVRMVYHRPPSTQLSEKVLLDEFSVTRRFAGSRQSNVTAVRVAPGDHRWRIGSTFSHMVSKRVLETYQERYSCGTERNGNYTRTRYCTRTKQRWVTRYETVVDAACHVDSNQPVRPNATYLVQFDFYGHNRCRLTYLEQHANPDGSFELVPVVAAPGS